MQHFSIQKTIPSLLLPFYPIYVSFCLPFCVIKKQPTLANKFPFPNVSHFHQQVSVFSTVPIPSAAGPTMPH